MPLGATPAWLLELTLRAPERGEPPRRFAGDERLQAGVHESSLLGDAGQLGSLPHEVIAQDERRSHTYEYAFTIRPRQAAGDGLRP